MQPIRVLVVGAGSRGFTYAQYALEHPDRMKVVAVAEPRAEYRERMVHAHGIDPAYSFREWKDAAAGGKIADLAIIATQDSMHADPAVAFASLGYDILLEKPMAPTLEECERIVRVAADAEVQLAVCHILRYTEHTRRLKEIIDSGSIGEVVSVQHFEPIGYWHMAHSFVRGNWRNEQTSSPLLLAKSCHDLDWLQFVMGEPCSYVSSFGALHHFRKEKEPAGAADRCVDCSVEDECPYSALKLYLPLVTEGKTGWPVDILTPRVTEENVMTALRQGPYGRCVYRCDNDVVDNQIVSMYYKDGKTATFSVNAFNNVGGRKTRIFGTMGELYLNVGDREPTRDGQKMTTPLLRRFDFLTEEVSYEKIDDRPETELSGHHYGDYRLMDAVVKSLLNRDPSLILSGPRETLSSHRTVFAAEEARRQNRVVEL